MRNSIGFTLAEMLVTLAIVSMLTVAALGVTAGLYRSEALVQVRQDGVTLETGLKELLAADVLNARRYVNVSDGLQLETYGCLDPRTLETRHLPVTVAYEVRRIGAVNWLIRRQSAAGQDDRAELVCRGVSRIALGALDSRQSAPGAWKVLPLQATVAVRPGDSASSELRFHFQLR